jgi:hypothetical protein
MSLLTNVMSLLKRLIQKRLQPWKRSGGAAAEMGTHDGTARTSERCVHTRAGMERGARGEGEGLLHHGSSGTRWGCAQDAGQPALPTHRQREEGLRLRTRRRLPGTERPTRHGQAEDHAKAS